MNVSRTSSDKVVLAPMAATRCVRGLLRSAGDATSSTHGLDGRAHRSASCAVWMRSTIVARAGRNTTAWRAGFGGEARALPRRRHRGEGGHRRYPGRWSSSFRGGLRVFGLVYGWSTPFVVGLWLVYGWSTLNVVGLWLVHRARGWSSVQTHLVRAQQSADAVRPSCLRLAIRGKGPRSAALPDCMRTVGRAARAHPLMLTSVPAGLACMRPLYQSAHDLR